MGGPNVCQPWSWGSPARRDQQSPEDSRQGLVTQNSFDVKSGELGPRQETNLFPPQREEEPVWKGGGHVLAQSRKAIRANGQSLYSLPRHHRAGHWSAAAVALS